MTKKEPKQYSPLNVEKDLHQRMKELKKYGKLNNYTKFVKEAIDAKLAPIETEINLKRLSESDDFHEIRKLREDNKDLKKTFTNLEEKVSILKAQMTYFEEEYAEPEKFASMSFEELQEHADKDTKRILERKDSEVQEAMENLQHVIAKVPKKLTKKQEKEVRKIIEERREKRKKLFKK